MGGTGMSRSRLTSTVKQCQRTDFPDRSPPTCGLCRHGWTRPGRSRCGFQNQVRQQERRMKMMLRKSLLRLPTTKLYEWSDVWGSLATMDTFFRSAGSGDNCRVFIVSDLVESMPGAGRRDFHKQHPANDAAQLRQMARADVPKIRSIYGLRQCRPFG